jgi:hypothetical protein
MHSRFKKGVSGNPRGRPRKAAKVDFVSSNPLQDLILREATELVSVTEHGKKMDLPALQVLIRKLRNKAIQGDTRASKIFTEWALEAQRRNAEEWENQIDEVLRYHNVHKPSFEQARLKGWKEPAQLPHPDHVDICFATKRVVIRGPQEPAEKDWWESLKFCLRDADGRIEALRERLRKRPRAKSTALQLAELEEWLGWLERKVPPDWNWRELVTDFDREYHQKKLPSRMMQAP